MSEMTLFKSGAAIPDYLREVTDDFTKSLAGTSGGKTISIKGGVFRMIVGGEEIAKNEDRSMNLVIVNAAQTAGRTYYAGAYVEGQIMAPACWSADCRTPDPSVENPQSATCATCPQNVKGSGQGDSRACRYSRRIAVVLEGDIGGNVYRLQVPGKSLFGEAKNDRMPLTPYAKFMAGHGLSLASVVTEVRFDTDQQSPVLKFRPVRPLARDELAVAVAQGRTDDAKQAIEMKFAPAGERAASSAPMLPAAFQPAPAASAEPDTAPTKRPTKRADAPAAPKDVAQIMSEWAGDDDA